MAEVKKVNTVVEVQMSLSEDEANALAMLIAKSVYFPETHGVYTALVNAGFAGKGYKVHREGKYGVETA